MSYHVTNAAEADLEEIAWYTQQQWGRDQRLAYLARLKEAFEDLDETPGLGMACDHYRAGYRQYLVGKHWIFYRRLNDDDIEIVRVLHERMDAPRHIE